MPIEKSRAPFDIRILSILTCFFLAVFFLIYISDAHQQGKKLVAIKGLYPNFIGREEILKQLDKHLLNNTGNTVQAALLWGEGGIGKTETAIAFANRNLKKFSILYTIDCSTEEVLYQSYLSLSEQLEIPLNPGTHLSTLVSKVHNYLENSKSRWLLIFDNVEFNLELPPRGKGVILLTAQNKRINQIDYCIEVPRFTQGESLALIERVLDVKANSEWEKFAEDFEGLPIALGEGIQYLKNIPFMSVSEYLIAREHNNIAVLKATTADTRHPLQFTSTFEKSLVSLETANPKAFDWLKICAYLHPDQIPKEWLRSYLLQNNTPSADLQLEESKILSSLIDRAYLRYNKGSESFSIHRLKQKLLKVDDPEIKKQHLSKAVKLLLAPLEEHEHFFDFENGYIKNEIFRYWDVSAVWVLENTTDLIDVEDMILLLNGLGNYYTVLQSNWIKGKMYFQQALGKCSQLQNGNERIKAIIMSNQAFSEFFLKDFETSVDLIRTTIRLAEEIQDHELILISFIDLIRNYLWMEDPSRSNYYVREYEKYVKKFQVSVSPLMDAEFLKWKGILIEFENPIFALECLFNAAKINEQFYKSEFNIQKMYISLAIAKIYCRNNECEKALFWLDKTDHIQKKLYSSKYHIEIASKTKCLASVLFRQKKYREALYHIQEGKEISDVIHGKEPNHYTSSLHDMEGDAFFYLGRKRKALEKYENSLKMTLASKDVSFPKSLRSLYNKIGDLYTEFGQIERAQEHYDSARRI